MRKFYLAGIAAALASTGAVAQVPPKPRLVVAISVDQFSANLFDTYRPHFQRGLKRLSDGVAFAQGFQSHSATETCPGHSTILSGVRPATSGIVANDWYGKRMKDGKEVFAPIYCVEDEREEKRTVSTWHVESSRYMTLGDRIVSKTDGKAYSVAGKDRSAVMLGGKIARNSWWYDADTGSFTSFPGTLTNGDAAVRREIDKVNASVGGWLDKPTEPPALSAFCTGKIRRVTAGPLTMGGGPRPKWPSALKAGARDPDALKAAASAFRGSEALDAATVEIAKQMIDKAGLGQDDAVDIIAVGLAATDYIGHGFGSGGPEMCAQLEAVDELVGNLFDHLDKAGIPFVAVLTADHGGEDMPERTVWEGAIDARRVSPLFGSYRDGTSPLGLWIAQKCKLSGDVLRGIGAGGDYWFTDAVADKPKAAACAKRAIGKLDGVETVITASELRKMKMPGARPDKWTIAQRVRASYREDRSGDFYVFFKPRITPIVGAGPGYVATHGTPWDYDRRVPILFWGASLPSANRTEAVETVDILPTLASLVGIEVAPAEVDGHCLDLVQGIENNCK